MAGFDDYLASVRASVREVSPSQAHACARDGALLLDIRERDETAHGMPTGAMHLARAFLEPGIARFAARTDQPVLLMCASGTRSVMGAATLRQMGYSNVASVQGGFNAWKEDGLPVVVPEQLTQREQQRYARHLSIPEVGEAGQLKLKRARVLLIGCGGLGSPAALYLAAAGVGSLTLLDFDVVDETNLQRQVLFEEDDIGTPKAQAARARLMKLNSQIGIHAIVGKLSAENAGDLVPQHDIVIDATDNFSARYHIGDACVKYGKPLVHASIYRFDGQVSVFLPGGPCYRCLYPAAPPKELAPSCVEAGVLGVLPGVMGTLQAVECLKLILGMGTPLAGTLLAYDALDSSFTHLDYAADPHCDHCARARVLSRC
jgi:molybdopterin/thiamine biosynthesis adenylyltransferase/rhodanese-related sulfurtransferase